MLCSVMLLWGAMIQALVYGTPDIHSSSNCSSHFKSSLVRNATTNPQNITFLALVPCQTTLSSASRECPDGDVFVHHAVKLAAEFLNSRNSSVYRGRVSRSLRVHVNIVAVETGVCRLNSIVGHNPRM